MSDSQQPEEVLLHCRIFDIIKKYQIGQSGKKHERFVVRHPGGVAILPVLSENEVVLIRQYRSAVDQYIYELPAGTREKGEDIRHTAERELIDNAGATKGEWNGFYDVLMYGFEDEECIEQTFVIPCTDDETLSILIHADKIADEAAAMERDDQISAVVDTLKFLDQNKG